MDLGTRITQLEERLSKVERSSRLSSASLDDGALEVRDAGGSLRALVGQQADGTTAANFVNGPVPSAPTAPYVASVLGGVAASWDGGFVNSEVVPLDFARVEVHSSETAGFTPTSATLQNTIETPQGATVTIPTETPLYVRLVTRTSSGTASAPSEQNGPIAPALVVADEIPDVITGKTLQTGTSGRRVVIAPDAGGTDVPGIALYSGHPDEHLPGLVSSTTITSGGGPQPTIQVEAPMANSGRAELTMTSPADTFGGEWKINTNSSRNYCYLRGDGGIDSGTSVIEAFAQDGSAGPFSFIKVEGDEIALYRGSSRLLITANKLDWLDSTGKGFTHDAAASVPGMHVTHALVGPHGQFSEEGDWTTPTFSTYWKQSTNGTYQTLRLSRGAKRARLDGCAMVATAYGPGNQIGFTVPTEYRPLKAHYFAVPNVASGSPGLLGGRIDDTGNVTLYTSGALAVNALYDFTNMSWPLD
ncbi:hypothetical protein ACF06X_33380 [Streptomyces sp. NPDC015346]|uniref:hypothetical protein n=1 Tax=Streptomyces sp. NPDC015346 TaxID=3364954 RepID=UPI0036F6A6E3